MKNFKLSLENPTAQDFQDGCERMSKAINTLAKAGVLTHIVLSFDDSREQSVRSFFKENGIYDIPGLTGDNE